MRIRVIIGVLFIIIPLAGIYEEVRLLNALQNGKPVKALITRVHRNEFGKRNFCDFRYKDVSFDKTVSNDFVRLHKRGDTVVLMHNEANPEYFAWPGSSTVNYFEIVAAIALSILGIMIIITRNQKITRYLNAIEDR